MVRKTVEFIGKYDYGIDPIEISKKYGIPLSAIVNLKSNENPFPPPESLIESVVHALDSIPRYPDPNYTLLKEKISEYVKLPPDHIAVGNGATEIIQSISNIFLEPFDKVVIPVPTYTLYFFYSMLRDASIETIKMKEEENFIPKSEEITDSCKGAKLLFLCSPNNPTGSVIEEKELCNIIESIDTPVIVDEAYSEFYGRSIVSKVKKYDNLIVVRSFSKFFGLAGLRVGYAITNPTLASLIEKVRQPFSISRIAEIAAAKALEEIEYFNKLKNRIISERERLMNILKNINGVRPFPSEANFILIKLLKIHASELVEELCKRGILVRNVTGLLGLDGEYIRVSIGKKSENDKFVLALTKVLQSRR